MLWVCDRCGTIHSQNPPECRNCGHRIFDSMQPTEYERQYGEEPPEAVDDAITMGTTPEPDFESSPDVAVDGSIDTGNDQEANSNQQQGDSSLLGRLWNWLS